MKNSLDTQNRLFIDLSILLYDGLNDTLLPILL